jgi:hypothetical protein
MGTVGCEVGIRDAYVLKLLGIIGTGSLVELEKTNIVAIMRVLITE